MKAKSVGDYMDAARSALSIRSDRALGRQLGLSQAAMWKWRNGTALPGDAEMQRLARLSKSDETEAVLLLNLWRAPDSDARDLYRRVLRRIGSTAGAAAIAAQLALPLPGAGSPTSGQLASDINVYYGKYRRNPRSSRGRVGQVAA